MIIEIPVFLCRGQTPIRAEIKIRTIGMDFWASLEHQLRYKKDLGNNEQYALITQKLTNMPHHYCYRQPNAGYKKFNREYCEF